MKITKNQMPIDIKHFKPIPQTRDEFEKKYEELCETCTDCNGDMLQGSEKRIEEILVEDIYLRYPPVVYQAWKWDEGDNYKKELTKEEIFAKIREYVETTFPECKFCVMFDEYGIIEVSLMEAPQEVYYFTPDENTVAPDRLDYFRSCKERNYLMTVHGHLGDDKYNNKGIFLTDYGKSVIASVCSYIWSYYGRNYYCKYYSDDNGEVYCSLYSDENKEKYKYSEDYAKYGDCQCLNFSAFLNIGKEDEPFRVVER